MTNRLGAMFAVAVWFSSPVLAQENPQSAASGLIAPLPIVGQPPAEAADLPPPLPLLTDPLAQLPAPGPGPNQALTDRITPPPQQTLAPPRTRRFAGGMQGRGTTGTTSAAATRHLSTPSMFGDFFGGEGSFIAQVQGFDFDTRLRIITDASPVFPLQPLNLDGFVLLNAPSAPIMNNSGADIGTVPALSFASVQQRGTPFAKFDPRQSNTINFAWRDVVATTTPPPDSQLIEGTGDRFLILPAVAFPSQDSLAAQLQYAAYIRELNAAVQAELGNMPGFVSLSSSTAVLVSTETRLEIPPLPSRLTYDSQSPDNPAGDGDQLSAVVSPRFVPIITINIPAGAVTGRQKIAENTSPLPRDRIYFNYTHFNNVPLIAGGTDVSRFTPGFEKTFFDGLMSIEMRLPFASTLDSDIDVDGTGAGTSFGNTGAVEFGDVTLFNKWSLLSTESFFFSGGLGTRVPTADDIRVSRNGGGAELFQINNETVHVLPFLGALWTPAPRWYFQGFLQLDVDVNGNPVYANLDPNDLNSLPGPRGDQGLTGVGRLNDPTYLYCDIGAGYWLYTAPDRANSRLSAVSTSFELHYNRSLSETDRIAFPITDPLVGVPLAEFVIGQNFQNIEILNATLGATFLFGNGSTLGVGYTVPLAGGIDIEFDGELRVTYNHIFGP